MRLFGLTARGVSNPHSDSESHVPRAEAQLWLMMLPAVTDFFTVSAGDQRPGREAVKERPR